jgi:hypothetical protein
VAISYYGSFRRKLLFENVLYKHGMEFQDWDEIEDWEEIEDSAD